MRFLIAMLISVSCALGAEEDRDFIVLPKHQVHEGDFFSTGGRIEISGIVKGDVYAFGSQIRVNGTVEGDVIALGGTIEIAGQVRGNARLSGGQIDLMGEIDRNVTAMGGNIEITPNARIGGNAVFTAGIIDLSGTINGNATMTASNARLLGMIRGNLRAYVGQLRLGSRAKIEGNLEYSSSNAAQISPGAEIDGTVTYHTSAIGEFFEGKWRRGLIFGTKLTGILMNLFFTFVIGWVFLKAFPKKVKVTLEFLQKKPWKSLWVGLLVLVLLPLACVILMITILGFPLALALLAFSLFTFYTAKVFPIIWISNRIFPKTGLTPNTLLTLLLGLILFFLVAQIPVFGGLISFIFTLLGLGAVALSRVSRARKQSKRAAK